MEVAIHEEKEKELFILSEKGKSSLSDHTRE